MSYKQVIVVRTDLNMGKGKIAAQCAHASVSALEKAERENPEAVSEWKETGQQKTVLKVVGKKELLELFENVKKLFPTALIRDAGLTQIAEGETTCIGIGPAEEREIDKYTGKLKLL